MKQETLKTLVDLRIIVGYLGEKDQFNWWDSSFYSKSALAFLNPLFPRTSELARCRAVQNAASILHDKAIGIGEIYHLFRLPEHIETQIHTCLQNDDKIKKTINFCAEKSSVHSRLESIASGSQTKSSGPISIGSLDFLEKGALTPLMASVYLDAFNENRKSYPYITSN